MRIGGSVDQVPKPPMPSMLAVLRMVSVSQKHNFAWLLQVAQILFERCHGTGLVAGTFSFHTRLLPVRHRHVVDLALVQFQKEVSALGDVVCAPDSTV